MTHFHLLFIYIIYNTIVRFTSPHLHMHLIAYNSASLYIQIYIECKCGVRGAGCKVRGRSVGSYLAIYRHEHT